MSDGFVLCPSFPVYPYLRACQCIAASDAKGQKADIPHTSESIESAVSVR